jgi:hypothetical protein
MPLKKRAYRRRLEEKSIISLGTLEIRIFGIAGDRFNALLKSKDIPYHFLDPIAVGQSNELCFTDQQMFQQSSQAFKDKPGLKGSADPT